MIPAAQTPERMKNVNLKQLAPTHETPEARRLIPCCFAASLSYIEPASRAEKRVAPSGFPNDMMLLNTPKFFKPKSSEVVGIIMETWTP